VSLVWSLLCQLSILWHYFQLFMKSEIRRTSGHVLLSLSTTSKADSLYSLQDDGAIPWHLTSVSSSSKVWSIHSIILFSCYGKFTSADERCIVYPQRYAFADYKLQIQHIGLLLLRLLHVDPGRVTQFKCCCFQTRRMNQWTEMC